MEILTEEERKAAFEEQKQLIKWAQSLTDKQIAFLMNGGWYNNAMKGYLMLACRYAGLDQEQSKAVLNGLRCALDDKDKQEAEEYYMQH